MCVPVSFFSGSQSQLSEEQVSQSSFMARFCRTMCDMYDCCAQIGRLAITKHFREYFTVSIKNTENRDLRRESTNSQDQNVLIETALSQIYSSYSPCVSPPYLDMSKQTLKGFPLFSGSIQYSPSPFECQESRISLQGGRMSRIPASFIDIRRGKNNHLERGKDQT